MDNTVLKMSIKAIKEMEEYVKQREHGSNVSEIKEKIRRHVEIRAMDEWMDNAMAGMTARSRSKSYSIREGVRYEREKLKQQYEEMKNEK